MKCHDRISQLEKEVLKLQLYNEVLMAERDVRIQDKRAEQEALRLQSERIARGFRPSTKTMQGYD